MKCRETRATLRSLMARALSLSAVAALMLNQAVVTPASGGDYRIGSAPSSADGQSNARSLSLGVGKSVVIDLPREVKDVLVADPKIANAVIRSAQRAYIIGGQVGQTNVVFFSADGQQVASYDIAVKRDLNGARAALKQILPNSDIQIDGLGESVVLSQRSLPSRSIRNPPISCGAMIGVVTGADAAAAAVVAVWNVDALMAPFGCW